MAQAIKDNAAEERLIDLLQAETVTFEIAERGYYDGLEGDEERDKLVEAILNSRRLAHAVFEDCLNQSANLSALETEILARQPYLVEALSARSKEYELLRAHDARTLRAFLASPKAVAWRYRLRDEVQEILANDQAMQTVLKEAAT